MKRKLFLSSVSTEDCPCKLCTDRYSGCHSSCVKYIDWKQKRDVKLQEVREQKNINNLLYNNQVQRNKKVSQEGGLHYGRRGNDTR